MMSYILKKNSFTGLNLLIGYTCKKRRPTEISSPVIRGSVERLVIKGIINGRPQTRPWILDYMCHILITALCHTKPLIARFSKFIK